ncbi:hypothetical protein [Kitasatospora kifunensis]|uniref:S-DNA-T family DNA segregation ATPase FtsK/SpoIIIE n=1 Tax=Kitasatospora kifunensis TaxID=58351 RepID=A0A7W7W0Y1_KITKI|nr:hypothetical protein [Kitasatospora kifunensis]MBB4929174.1 S-DNA-T family DNA segregation ATPase FtsK/SpoIIIE [Kitasatospora kifunensis]
MTDTAVNGHDINSDTSTVDFDKSAISLTKLLGPEQIAALQQRMANHTAAAGHASTVGTIRLPTDATPSDAVPYEYERDDDGVYDQALAIPAQAQPERTPWRHQPYREPRPDAFLSWDHFKAAAADTFDTARNLGAWHAWRLPKYTWKFAALAALGGWTYGGRARHFLQAREYGDAIDQAVRAGVDAEQIAAMRAEHSDVRKARWSEKRTLAGMGLAGSYVAATVYLAVQYGLIAASPAGLLALGVLHLLGRREWRRRNPDEVLALLEAYQEKTSDRVVGAAEINEALRLAEVIGQEAEVEMYGPVRAVGPSASEAVFKLPGKATITTLEARREVIAKALNVDVTWLDFTKAGDPGEVKLWVSSEDPLAVVRESPLLKATGPIDVWGQGIPIGFNRRGEIIYLRLRHVMALIGGMSRTGKGMLLRSIICGLALDPRINIRLVVGAKPGEHRTYGPACATFFGRRPDRLELLMEAIKAEAQRREDYLETVGRAKLTEADLQAFPLEIVIIDEAQLYLEKPAGGKLPRVVSMLEDLAGWAAALNIVILVSTQDPDSDTIPRKFRNNAGVAIATRTKTAAQTNAILGDGATGNGLRAHDIPDGMGGQMITNFDGAKGERARSCFIEDEKFDGALPIIDLAMVLRTAANRAPGQFRDRIEEFMLERTGESSVAGGPTGSGRPGIPAGGLGILGLMLAAFEHKRNPERMATGELLALLAEADEPSWGPAAFDAEPEGEDDQAAAAGLYVTRGGKALSQKIAAHLDGTGRSLSTRGWQKPVRANGYYLADIKAAAGIA